MPWTVIAWVSLGLAFCSALAIAADEVRHPQTMGVMNLVWPITGLYFSVFAVWAYFALGRKRSRQARQGHRPNQNMQQGMETAMHRNEPSGPQTAAQVAIGTSHCGAGCTVADVVTDFAIAGSGLVLFGSTLWTGYLLDFVVAWAVGIAFQYFAIRPMRQQLSSGAVVWAAVKADTLSILAFQVGMYLWMALVYFKLFPAPHLTPFDPRYWFMMQIAMICGFLTSLPMNRLLIGMGLKEAM